ncbi:hypothetical protein DAPPUDRAFT_341342 [Daphnia pulex]|uniref:Uncharacterized protein n=1 Tax=Daphnia pulex TaxID=6669 RepID=E9I5C7_DAPPU|nr:hypothetical protein DAPPUDRAFT_341342 [Daphnia pulex]|eukprot:EFX60804.1 hypothetical protein DAPPUDRAFT_341342 [Daphnia pulex]
MKLTLVHPGNLHTSCCKKLVLKSLYPRSTCWSFDDVVNEEQTPQLVCESAANRKSNRVVSLTEKVKLLHQEKKKKVASDGTDKEKLALKAEKEKKMKADRRQLAKKNLDSFQQTSTLPSVSAPTSVLSVSDDDDQDSQDFDKIMFKLKENILNYAAASSTA